MKKAVVIGSTGMVGIQLIDLLTNSNEYSEIVSLVRRTSGITHPKLSEHPVDFDKIETWSPFVKGDVLFSCMGTTIAKAKTKENQYKIDYSYQYNVAETASANGVQTYVLISSAGANPKSTVFYSKMKGQLDEAVLKLPFKNIFILRPGQLYGNRTEKRLGEKTGLSVMFFLNRVGILRKYKPIHAHEVARAMINIAENKQTAIVASGDIFKLI
jgi:uncharacterized protein YbjT (DUF2867 family)